MDEDADNATTHSGVFACETGRHIAAIYNSLIHRIVDVIYDGFGVDGELFVALLCFWTVGIAAGQMD